MLEDVVNKEIAPWRFSAWVFALFAALAFTLSMLGLFSLVSLDVANRRQEFAIRIAVGATRAHMVGGVFRSAGRGPASALRSALVRVVATRSLQGLLFGVTLADRVTYAVGDRAGDRRGPGRLVCAGPPRRRAESAARC